MTEYQVWEIANSEKWRQKFSMSDTFSMSQIFSKFLDGHTLDLR